MINNPYTEQFIKYKKGSLSKRLKDKFRPKSYHQRYSLFRILGLISSYIINVFSCVTASALVYFFLESLIRNAWISGAITFVFLIIIESTKRFSSSRIVIDYFVYKTWNLPFILFSLLLVVMSIAFSYNGSQIIIKQFTKPPILINQEKELLESKGMMDEITKQIEAARETRYNGITTRTSQRTIEKLTDQLFTLQNEISQIKIAVKEKNDLILEDHTGKLQHKAFYIALFSLVLELMFLLCIWYLQYYDYRSYIELNGVELDESEEILPSTRKLNDKEIKKLKNKIRTYYKRAMNPRSGVEARERNMGKVEGWVIQLENNAIKTDFDGSDVLFVAG